MRRLGTGAGFAGAKLSEVLPRSERSLATVRMTENIGCGDLEPEPASLARSCPRSFRPGRVAPFGQDDKLSRGARFDQDDGPCRVAPFDQDDGVVALRSEGLVKVRGLDL